MRSTLTLAMLAATLAACSPESGTGPARSVAQAPGMQRAMPAASGPSIDVSPAPPKPLAPPVPVPIDLSLLPQQAWRVTESSAVAVGSLYVFLPDSRLLVATPGSTMLVGSWKHAGPGRLTMVEDGLAYPADVLELSTQKMRLRSHNPGAPVEMTLQATDAPAQPVPRQLLGEWNASAAACGQSNEARLRIEPEAIQFQENGGRLLEAFGQPGKDMVVVAKVTGEGNTRLMWRRFRLSADGRQMTDVTEGATGLVRVRCG